MERPGATDGGKNSETNIWIDHYEDDGVLANAASISTHVQMAEYPAESQSQKMNYPDANIVLMMKLDFQGSIFLKNSILTSIKTNFNIEELGMFEDDFSESFLTIMKDLYLATFKGDFQWALYENEVAKFYSKMRYFIYDACDAYSMFLYSEGFQEIIPLEVLVALISQPYDRYGYPLYDSVSKAKSIMLSNFLVHHLGADSKYLVKLEANNLRNMSSLLRIHVRQTNRRDKTILAKYLNAKFDVRKFAATLLDIYIPNVSWRYIGGEVYQPYWVIKTIRMIFELGLYTVAELPELLTNLTNKLENLLKFEQAVKKDINDGKLSGFPTYLGCLAMMIVMIRKEVAAICLHATVLYNDFGLEESLPWGPKFNQQFDYQDSFERTIFNQPALSGVIYTIMSRFLILEDTYDSFWMEIRNNSGITKYSGDVERTVIEERKKFDEIFKELFMMFSKKTNDLFSSSNQVVSEAQMQAMLGSDDQARSLMDEAVVVRTALEELLLQHKILKYDEPKVVLNLARKSALIYRKILNLIKEKPAISEAAAYQFTAYLALNNTHKILLVCIIMIIELLARVARNPNHECIRLGVELLSIICQNEIGQILFFTDSNWELIDHFSTLRPVYFAQMIDTVFSSSKELFYRQETLFKNLIRIYKELVKSVEENIQGLIGDSTEGPNALLGEKDSMDNINMPVKSYISLLVFNNTLQNLIIVQGDPNSANYNKNLDLVVQRTLCQMVNKILLPQIFSRGQIALNSEGALRMKKFPLIKDNRSMNAFASKMVIYDEEIRTLLFNVGWSTIELFTKCTSRLYYDFVRCQTVSNLAIEAFEQDFGYLLQLEDGLTYRTILMNLFSNFHIFPTNHCVSDSRPQFSLTETNLTFLDSMIDGDCKVEEVVQILIGSMDNVKTWTDSLPNRSLTMSSTKDSVEKNPLDSSRVDMVKAFVCKGVMPSVYKYLKGLISLLTVSHADNNKSKITISKILDQIRLLETKFIEWEEFLKQEYGISYKKSEIDGLLSLLKFGQGGESVEKSKKLVESRSPATPNVPDKPSSPDQLGTLFGNLNMQIGESEVLIPKPDIVIPALEASSLLMNNLELDPDEMVCEDLYNVRAIAKRLTRTIQETLSPEYESHIESFDRLNALKRKKSKLDELFLKKVNSRKPKVMSTLEKESRQKRLESIIQGKEPATHLQQFKAVCEVYELKKSEWLVEGGLNNSFFLYMWSQKEAVQVFLKYLVKIFDPKAKNSRKIDQSNAWYGTDTYYQKPGFTPSLSCLTAAMMLEDEQPSTVLSFLDSIFANVPGTKSAFFKNFDSQNANKDSILTTFDFTWVMARFLFFKTFHDTTYEVLSQVSQTMVDLIKSFSEGTNTHLRRLLRDEIQQVNIVEDSSERSVLKSFSSQVDRMLELTESSFLKYNSYLGMIERPENYTIMINCLRILIEMTAGPDTRSQNLVFETSLNKMMVVVDRIVDDLNSPFYKFKLTVLEYLNCLSQEILVSSDNIYTKSEEGNNFDEARVKVKITETVANNIRIGMIESLTVRLIKKLYVHTCTKNKPWFKAKPIEKLKQDFERQKQELLKKLEEASTIKLNQLSNNPRSKRLDLYQTSDDSKIRYMEEIAKINQKLSKLMNFEETYSAFENKDSVILEEMESTLTIKSYQELVDLYCKDPEFSGSNIIKICAELVKLSFNLSKSAEYFKNSTNERAKRLYAYYGSAVPLTVLENIDLSEVPDLSGEEPSEEIKVFMFLALLVNQIEVAIPTTTEEGSIYQTKFIMFQLPPQCFMLSPETKNSFIDQMNTEEAVAELQSFHSKFEIEMNSNLQTLRQSTFLYKISLHDTLSLLKKVLWYLGLVQNLLLLFASRRPAPNAALEYYIFSESVFTWTGVGMAIYTFAVLLIWGYGRYSQNVALAKEDIFRGKRRKRASFYEKLQIYFVRSMLKKSTSVMLIWHLVFSLLGVFAAPFFFTLQLLTLVLISHTASYVVRSITTHIRKLAITFILAVFVMFSFAYLVYRYYNKDWDGLVDNGGTIEMCKDLWECLFYSVDLGLRNDGGLSDAFATTVSHGRPGLFISKFIFDMSFFILVSLVLKNVAFGIIIDTFASMRDEITQREAYLNSTCVVCKRTKEMLAKNDENFSSHIASKHDIWMYVFYRVYLNTKDKDDFNGIEAVIHGYILEDSTDWIPTNKITEKKSILERIDNQLEQFKVETQKLSMKSTNIFQAARYEFQSLNTYLPSAALS